MRKGTFWIAVIGVLLLGLAFGPALWAAPGQSPQRQTVPTATAPPPPTEPPPLPTEAPPSGSSSGDTDSEPAAPSLAQLEKSLAAAWTSADWPQVIAVVGQILAVNPDYDGMLEKLYTAYVNLGHQFLAAGDEEGAIAQFNRALEIKPGGKEALTGLQQASGTSVAPSASSSAAVAAGRPSEPLLPDAGGPGIGFQLGVALMATGILALAVSRRRV
jgi:hypothetical protein